MVGRGAESGVRGTGAAELRAQAVTVQFEGVRAVDGVNLSLRRGELMALIGPNGAGKTTFLNAVTGFQALANGKVWLGAEEVTSMPPPRLARRGVARTFQGTGTFPSLSVFQNIEVASLGVGSSRAAARARARDLVDMMSLESLRDRTAGTLSQGEERRVAIARGAAMAPQFFLMDEPAAGLNDHESVQLVRVIRQLRDEVGCGILIVDHDMHLIMTLSERIHVLDAGRTIAEGTPDEVRQDPAVVAAYLGAASETEFLEC